MSKDSQQPSLLAAPGPGVGRPGDVQPSPVEVHEAFDPTRLTQARNLVGITKRRLADELG